MPRLSEHCARVFAAAAALIRESQSTPRDRVLAERYRKASNYLYSRIGR